MRRYYTALSLLPLLTALAAAAEPFQVKVIDELWHDTTRNRDVPVRIYQPVLPNPEPMPIIIFSHGLGGSREGYAYLGQHWASHGYLCVHPQHAGSDGPAMAAGGIHLMETMKKSVADPQNLINRPKDVSFVIDRLTEESGPKGAFAGQLDMSRIGVAGHSFGAYTTLAIAGQQFTAPGGREFNFVDKRVKAAIAMSEQPPRPLNADKSMAQIKIPILHMAGTEDLSPFGDLKAADRRQPYDLTPASADQYLILLDGARHLTFAGIGVLRQEQSGQKRPANDVHQAIESATTRFWDAYLRNDPGALKDVREGGLKKLVRPTDQVESKLSRP